MKKLFEMPSIELTKFDVEDVITASSSLLTTEEFANAIGTEADLVTTWNSAWNDSLNI